MTQAVKRACDACHRRKVKCDGVNPCRNCAQAQLSCTYNAVPQKKGPKGSRAKVISELRETQRQTSLAAKVQSRIHGVPCPGSSSSSGSAPTPGLLTSELIKECTNFFFENMYAQLPILDRQHIDQQVLYMEQNHDAYCMLTALCAFVMLQPGMSMPATEQYNFDMMPGANIVSSQLLVEETQRVRRGFEYLDNITQNAVVTDFFLFGCYYAQEAHDRAWFYLRQATTMVHMAGMNKEEYYLQPDPSESSRCRRLFWLLYATERAYAIQRNRPLTLQATINLPTMGDDPRDPLAHQLQSFVTLANLFKPFDDAFVSTWNKTCGNMSTPHVSGLNKQLSELVRSWSCQDPSFADQHINQSWLKNTIWQLTNGSGHGDDSVPYQYNNPNMSNDLLMSMASQFPGQGMELLKSGLMEKLMEITHTMTELLAMQPAPTDPFAPSPRQHMSSLLSIVALSRNGDHRFLPVLMTTVAELLPKLVNPMLQNPPENTQMGNIDIFDGFGNAGMAQVPPQMQMNMDGDYDRKFSAEEYDKQYAMEMNNTTPESQTNSNGSTYGQAAPQQQSQDMNSSYVSSPGIMSPGMEYPPQMSTFASTPMSEMVMSPMGHPSQQNPMNAPQQPHMAGHSHDGMAQHHMPMSQHLPTSHPLSNMRGMQQPTRQNSFHLQGPPQPQMRTVGDFQGLQGRNDARQSIVGMGSMSNEIDFGALQ